MTKIGQIFKSIDEFVFKSLEDIKAQSFVQSTTEQLNSLGEKEQKIINHSLSLIIILLPLFIVSFLFWQNHQQKNTIQVKENIIQLVEKNKQNKNQIGLVERNIIGPGSIRQQSDLDRLINSSLSSRSLPSDSITVTNFEQTTAGEGLTQTSATINFTKFTTQNLTGIFQDLVQRQKAKISAIMIQKKTTTDLLEGSFQVYHFAKEQMEE